jgi:hypothetical protein
MPASGNAGAAGGSDSAPGRSLVDELADVLVYAPLGLIISIGEDMPKLAEKGRAKVESQVTTARVVGQFAVAMGRRKAEEVMRQRFAAPARSRGAPETAEGGEAAAKAGAGNADVAASGSDEAPKPAARRRPAPAAPATAATARRGATVGGEGAAAESGGSGGTGGLGEDAVSVESLAIPGYDSLAASQVVQRLEGLLPEELDEVRRYEKSTRGRRTILGRIDQLGDDSQG